MSDTPLTDYDPDMIGLDEGYMTYDTLVKMNKACGEPATLPDSMLTPEAEAGPKKDAKPPKGAG